MESGVLYVATGNAYIEEAKQSIQTLRSVMPDVSTTLVTGESISVSGFDRVIQIADPAYSYRDKISGMKLSPYDKTVFLDTDVYVCDDFRELFEMLEEVDIAAAIAPNRDLNTANLDLPQSFPEYNTGVIPYASSAMAFLDRWKSLYGTDHRHDQPAFRKAAFEGDVRISTLPREYNCLYGAPGHLVKDVKIFHGNIAYTDVPAGRRWGLLSRIRYGGGAERVVDELNSCSGHRHYHRHGSTACRDLTIWNRFWLSIRRHGIDSTLRDVAVLAGERLRASLNDTADDR